MKVQKQREVCIEYERVQLIRKRARTHFFYCDECQMQTDFVFLNEAAKLFSTRVEVLFQFIRDTGSHYRTKNEGEIFICLNALIEQMKARTNRSAKLLGSEKI